MKARFLLYFASLFAVGLLSVIISADSAHAGEAETSTSTVREPFEKEAFQPCIGELTDVSGYAEFVFHTTLNPDGSISLSVSHVNTNGLTGTTESGDQVIYSEVDQSVVNTKNPSTGAGVYHTTVKITMADDNGQLPNVIATFIFNTIINDDGSTKHDTSNIIVKCTGGGND